MQKKKRIVVIFTVLLLCILACGFAAKRILAEMVYYPSVNVQLENVHKSTWDYKLIFPPGKRNRIAKGDYWTLGVVGVKKAAISDKAKKRGFGAWIAIVHDKSIEFRATRDAVINNDLGTFSVIASSAEKGTLPWCFSGKNIGFAGKVIGPVSISKE